MDFIKALFLIIAILFMILTAPFVVAHIIEHWDDAPYPHSGFTPECPEWTAPEDDLYLLQADTDR